MTTKTHGKPRKYWFGGKKTEGLDEAVQEALSDDRWELGSEENWDSYWFTGMPKASVFRALTPGKTVNHIPGNNGLTVKSMLYDTLEDGRKRVAGHPNEARFDFFPRSFVMPHAYFDLQEAAAADPEKLWIQKPKGLSRGRGIKVLKDASLAPKSEDWMVQEYLHRPHLYNGHKYVLRCYVVVRSVDPLRVYWYTEGFAKLASEKYSTDPASLSNLFVHLTNPDVNEGNDDAPASVVFISFTKYRQWLRDQGHDDAKIFQDLEDLIVLTMMSARERMRQRLLATDTHEGGCFELFGLDCMLDADLKPWILECNLSPSLDVCSAPEDGGIDEARIKRQVVFDLISMIGANEDVPDWSTAETYEEGVRAQWDWEKERSGGFRCVYPGDNPEKYITSFPVPRYSDVVLAEHVMGRPLTAVDLVPNHVEEFVVDGALSLYAEPMQQFFAPNKTAAWIWLQLAEGKPVVEIIDELADQAQAPHHHVARDVWNTLAEWAQKGLVALKGGASQLSESRRTGDTEFIGIQRIGIGSSAMDVQFSHQPVMRMLSDLDGCAQKEGEGITRVDILKGAQGYTITKDARVVASDVRLSRLVPLLVSEVFSIETGHYPRQALLTGGLISVQGQNILLTSRDPARIGDASVSLSRLADFKILGGAVRLATDPGIVTALPFPIWLPEDTAETLGADSALQLSQSIHEISVGRACRTIKPESTEGPITVDNIVLLEDLEDGPSVIEALSAAEALPEIWSGASASNAVPSEVAAWIDGVGTIRLKHNGVDALDHLLKEACRLS